MNNKIKNLKPIKNLVSGGAGFLGSHLIDELMKKNEQVICLDNYLQVKNQISRNGLVILILK